MLMRILTTLRATIVTAQRKSMNEDIVSLPSCKLCQKRPILEHGKAGWIIACPVCRFKNGLDYFSAQTFPWSNIEDAANEWQKENRFSLESQ
jgi:hypothetical protein